MLVMAKMKSSRQSAIGILNDTFLKYSTKPKKGKPSHMLKLRNDKGGNSLTPSLSMGQLKPQTKVKMISKVICCRLMVI